MLRSDARLRWLLLAVICGICVPVSAVDYEAVASGLWHNPSSWSPVGIPGKGDRVIDIGTHSITVDEPAEIGDETQSVALHVSGSGALIVGEAATLDVYGHLNHSGYRGRIVIHANGALRFAPAGGQLYEFQQNSSEQRIEFVGRPNERALIGLTPGSQGHYYFATVGFRDSVLRGSYGRIEDALNPASDEGFRMYLNNAPGVSSLVADHIEFLRCGEIGVFGLGAGEHTEVVIHAWSFREQAYGGSAATRPGFWFDGYGDISIEAPESLVQKSITSIVSDTKINLRFVQGYTLDDFVLGGSGSGNVRSNNNGGNAVSHSNVFMASNTPGSALNLIADTTDTVYFYMDSDNPHGWSTQDLRNDALLTNYWFEAAQRAVTDRGDAVLSNGPQRFVSNFGGAAPTLTLTHSGLVGTAFTQRTMPTLITLNNSEGIHFDVDHVIAAANPREPMIALDENGVTPPGTGMRFTNSVVFGKFSAIGIGSASASVVVEPDTFDDVDANLYFKTQTRGPDGGLGVHQAELPDGTDASSQIIDPRLFDSNRNLAHWDESLGGPGTASNAVIELKKRNDDSGYNPAYTVENLVAWVAQGFSVTNPKGVGRDGTLIGPNSNPPRFIGFVVGRSASLSSSERVIRDQLLARGMVVRLYDDNSIAPLFTEINDALLVSSSVLSNKLDDDLRPLTIPILVWDHEQFGQLGLTGNQNGLDFGLATQQSEIELGDGGGTGIGSGLPTGLVQITANPRTLAWGIPGSGAFAVANVPEHPNQMLLFGYPTGATLADGSIAAGPRLAWYEQNFSAERRTTEGTLLFEQALDWLFSEALVQPSAPEILQHPQDIAGEVDDEVVLSVTVRGFPEPDLQWFLDGAEVVGATAAELSLVLATDTAGDYVLRASNEQGDVFSDTATVTVLLDETPPELETVLLINDTTLELRYSEALGSASVNLANFQLEGEGDPAAAISAASLLTPTTIRLATTPLSDTPYTLMIENVTDVAGNAAALAEVEVAGPSDATVLAVVVGQPSLNRPGDREMVAFLQELGYEVDVYDDNGITLAATATADVVIISSTVVPANVGSIFAFDARPLLVAESGIFDDLGLTGTRGGVDFGVSTNGRTKISVVDNSSPVTAGLSLGALDVTSGFHKQTWGMPGQQAQILATINGSPQQATLFSYGAGDILPGGSSASGARLGWFTTDRSFRDATPATEQMMQQGLSWLLSNVP